MPDDEWARIKKEALESIIEDRIIGYLDPYIDPILIAINEVPLLATTSSCIGRIVIVEGSRYWLRDKARIVYKSHDHITVDDLKRVLRRPFKDLWLIASGPILHIKSPSFSCSLEVIASARESGFKHSGIISAKNFYVIELMSSTQIYMPLRLKGTDLIDERGLEVLVDMANKTVDEGRQRLSRLVEGIRGLRSCQGSIGSSRESGQLKD